MNREKERKIYFYINMDLSKYRYYLNRLVSGERLKNDIYKKIITNKDGLIPLISSNQNGPTETMPLESVIPLEISREPYIKEFNSEYTILQEARTMRDILPKTVTESTICELLEKYKCAEIALNVYFEQELCCCINR